MPDEKNILKLIKELGWTQAEVIGMINEKAGKDKELLTQEEKAEAELAAKLKLEAKAKAEAKKEAEKDKTPPEDPRGDDSVMAEIEKLKAEVEELKKSGKVPGKEPSTGKTLEKGALPESTTYTVQKNMFEVDV